MEIIALAIGLIALEGSILNRLRILQEKDYWRTRVMADKNAYSPKKYELLAHFVTVSFLLQFVFPQIKNTLPAIAILSFLAIIVSQIVLILRKQFKRPKITLRILLILFVTNLIWLLLALVTRQFILITALFIPAAIGLVLLSNALVRQVAFIGHKRELARASAQLNFIPNIKVIGITGSYGKSTTKLFLNKILAEEKKFISTPGSINTDIGLAKSLNQQFAKLTPEELNSLEVAVLEMDAYVIGTIARITKYFPLDIAVITSINEQHLETFGGEIRNTMIGNFQIVEGLKPGGSKVGVFNMDNSYCEEMSEWFIKAHGTESLYRYGTVNGIDLDVSVIETRSIIAPGEQGIRFTLKFSERLGGEALDLTLPVLGEFNAANYACAALLAKLNGVSTAAIVAASKKVELKQKTLKLTLTRKRIEVIDDTFNANPASIEANIDLLAKRKAAFGSKDLVIFTGLYDLGEKSAEVHAEIGKKLAAVSDRIIISNENFGELLSANLSAGEREKFLITTNIEEIKAEVKKFSDAAAASAGDKKVAGNIFMMNSIPAAIYKYIFEVTQ